MHDIQERTTILGLSLGTSTLGLAVLRDTKLLEYRTKQFRGTWSKWKLHIIMRVLKWYCLRYSVTALAIKYPLQYSPYIHELSKAIKQFAKQYDITIYTLSIHDLKSVATDMAKNKEDVMKCAVSLYPELLTYATKARLCRNPYYTKLFEAVLAAHVV